MVPAALDATAMAWRGLDVDGIFFHMSGAELATVGAGVGTSRPRVLVVEDNPDLRLALRSMLSAHYDVMVADDGDEGIEQVRASVPSLVLSDLMMPHRNGFDLCRAIRTDPRTAHIPVIILTARGEIDKKLEGFESGADDYLQKPFNSRELLARVKSLIENRALQRQLVEKNEELARALEELREAQQKLVEGERLKTALNMAGALAHEINNPLSAIIGFCDLLRMSLDPGAPVLRDVERIVEQANRIARTVREIQSLREVRFVPYVGTETIVDLRP
jgi:DNA-binding response OmpR family regulator